MEKFVNQSLWIHCSLNSLRTHELDTFLFPFRLSHFGSCRFYDTHHEYFTPYFSWRAYKPFTIGVSVGILKVFVFSMRCHVFFFFFLLLASVACNTCFSNFVRCCCWCVIFRVQNFRLHPSEAHGNQSFEVHQINRMFNATAITSNHSNHRIVSNASGNLVNSPRKSASANNSEYSRRRHHHHHHHHRSRETTEMAKENHICLSNLNTDNNCLDKNSNRHSITRIDAEPTRRFDNGNW